MKIAVLVTGYPVFSETFIARELLGLEQAGSELRISALGRWPFDQPNTFHRAIAAPVDYLSLASTANLLPLWRAWRRMRTNPNREAVLRLLDEDIRLIGRRRAVRAFAKALVWCERNREFTPDVIYAHWISGPASVARYASCLTGVPWCCSAHARDVWKARPGVLRSRVAHASGVVTCNSQAFGLLQAAGIDPGKVFLSHHGIDLDRFSVPPACEEHAGPLRILAVGRAVPKKGFDVLLKALALLPQDLDWRFSHAGGGLGRYRLRWQARRLGITQRTSWLGAVRSNRLLDHYRQADIFVQASVVDSGGDQDGLPNVLVEACSQGVACIATRLASIQDLMVHEVNGLLVESGNAAELASAITRLAREPLLRRQLGEAARQRVGSQFDCEHSVAFVRSMLETVASTRARQA